MLYLGLEESLFPPWAPAALNAPLISTSLETSRGQKLHWGQGSGREGLLTVRRDSLWSPADASSLCGQHARPEHLESSWEPTCWHHHRPTSTDGKTEAVQALLPTETLRDGERAGGTLPSTWLTLGALSWRIPPPRTTAEGLPLAYQV